MASLLTRSNSSLIQLYIWAWLSYKPIEEAVLMAVSDNPTEVGAVPSGSTKGHTFEIPTSMKTIRYNKVKDLSVITIPMSKTGAREVLVKGPPKAMF